MFQYTILSSLSQILILTMVGNRYTPGFIGMLVLFMTAFLYNYIPAILFQQLYYLFNFHPAIGMIIDNPSDFGLRIFIPSSFIPSRCSNIAS